MVCDYSPTVTRSLTDTSVRSLCSWLKVDALFKPRGSNAAPHSSFLKTDDF